MTMGRHVGAGFAEPLAEVVGEASEPVNVVQLRLGPSGRQNSKSEPSSGSTQFTPGHIITT